MAVTYSAVLVGAEVREIEVETFVGQGFSGLSILGIGGDTLRDLRERVRAVLEGVGVALPARRIVVNLAPSTTLRLCRTPMADLEFAVAASVVRALDEARGTKPPAGREYFAGSLSLTGDLRPPANALLLRALQARSVSGSCRFHVAAGEAEGQEPAASTYQCFSQWYQRRLEGGRHSSDSMILIPAKDDDPVRRMERATFAISLFEATPLVLVALLAAAAGSHHILLAGEPGVGKSFALRRLPDLLPPLTPRERLARELLVECGDSGWERPFRNPHHTTTGAALIGGAQARLGEVTLAHLGVLFLDELAEFPRPALEGLREPLDAGSVLISRAGGEVKYPARFLLAASTNPCPCGYLFSRRKACRCNPGDARKYQKKFSGPLLDRFSIQIPLLPGDDERFASNRFAETAQGLLRMRGPHELARRLFEVQKDTFSLERAPVESVQENIVPAWLCAKISRRGERELAAVAKTLAALFPEIPAAGDHFWEQVAALRGLEGMLCGNLM